jgi:hypothetical protein
MRYKMTFKKVGFFNRKRTEIVKGHHYEAGQDKMVLMYHDGSVKEIAHWKDYEVTLGEDWVLALKKEMEKEATGLNVPLDID